MDCLSGLKCTVENGTEKNYVAAFVYVPKQGNRRLHFGALRPRCALPSPLPADRRCRLSSTCRRRTKPRIYAPCTKKLGKDRLCGSGDILADGQTDRQTHTHTHTYKHRQTYSSRYFATAPAGEVKTCNQFTQFWRILTMFYHENIVLSICIILNRMLTHCL